MAATSGGTRKGSARYLAEQQQSGERWEDNDDILLCGIVSSDASTPT